VRGLVAFYVESKELEEDLDRIVKKHNLILVPLMLSRNKLLLVKYLPEVKAIEKGKLKAKKANDVLKELLKRTWGKGGKKINLEWQK